MNPAIKTHYSAIINGVPAQAEESFAAQDASTGARLASITRGTPTLVDAAVAAAASAQKTWKETLYEERSALLNKLADELEKQAQRLALIDAMDVGRRVGETLIDYHIAIAQYRYFAGAILTHEGYGRPIPNGYLIAKREPIGVVGQIIPWNVPAIMVALKVAPAVAAGNTVVLKPDENASLSTLEFGEIANRIFPPGVINIVPGFGGEVGAALTAHPGVAKLAFTGSPQVGKTIGIAGASRLVPVSLELGGKSPNIIFPDVRDIDAVVDNAVFAFTYCNGQSCLAGTRLFVHDDIYARVMDSLGAALARIKVGSPLADDTLLSGLVNEKQGRRVLGYLDSAHQEGAKLAFGGHRVSVPGHEHGYFIEPTVFEVKNHMRIAQEEIFGPVLSVLRWSDYDNMIKEANGVPYGLAAGIYTSSLANAHRTADALESGNVWINHYFNLNSGCPFGGVKESGIGREHCHETLNMYSHLKSITIQNEPDAPWFVPAR